MCVKVREILIQFRMLIRSFCLAWEPLKKAKDTGLGVNQDWDRYQSDSTEQRYDRSLLMNLFRCSICRVAGHLSSESTSIGKKKKKYFDIYKQIKPVLQRSQIVTARLALPVTEQI